MSIHRRCCCGAFIRLPDSAAGHRARCKSCGEVFTVPPAPSHAVEARRPAPVAAAHALAADEPIPLLDDLAAPEDDREDIGPLDLSFDPRQISRAIRDEKLAAEAAETANPLSRFLVDVGRAFLFVANPGNLVAFLAVASAPWILGFIPILGWVLAIIAQLYLYAYFMGTVTEMASGEDDLPSVQISSLVDDLLMPLLCFLGTLLWVSLPAIACATITYHALGHVHYTAVTICAALGLLLWPVVVLAVAIGGGFNGVWPHVVVRTAMSAPHAYAVVCAAVLAAFGLVFLPDTPMLAGVMADLYNRSPLGTEILVSLLNTYAMLVAMRVIGLFYRHYKHRFPWKAE